MSKELLIVEGDGKVIERPDPTTDAPAGRPVMKEEECDNCIENEKLIYGIINFLNNSDNPLRKYLYKSNLLEGIQELLDEYQEVNNTLEELKMTLDGIL